MRRPWILLCVGAGIAALVAALVAWRATTGTSHESAARVPGASSIEAGPTSVAARKIPGAGGADLIAYVITPLGRGRHPLVVMPSAWGAAANQYLVVGTKLAAHGYQVVSYAQRGFSGSAGVVDIAGAATQADVSAVITWALGHTAASPGGVAAVGVSYGAGASLLAAERDSRVKVVVAMSGWSDLAASFYPNDTPSQQVVNVLMASAANTGKPGAEVQTLLQASSSGNTPAFAATVASLSSTRSALNGVQALNKNRTAVMLASGFEDSIFPPSQQARLFGLLTGPKRLQLARGDHGGPETSGLLGTGPSQVWDDATAWLDRYLGGSGASSGGQDGVHLEDVDTGAWRRYPNLAAAGRPNRFYLAAPGVGAAPKATLGNRQAAGWTHRISVGVDSGAGSGPPDLDPTKVYRPLSGVQLAAVPRALAAVWDGPATGAATLVSGVTSIHLTATSAAPNVSLFAYLYDVDATGTGRLMTFKPYTLAGLTPGTARAVDIALEPISWSVAPGHHLSLAIDTVDPRYQSLSVPGSSVAFSSSPADPSTLTVPIG